MPHELSVISIVIVSKVIMSKDIIGIVVVSLKHASFYTTVNLFKLMHYSMRHLTQQRIELAEFSPVPLKAA
jgi:hypothetical protein